jgi:hypothetical protein
MTTTIPSAALVPVTPVFASNEKLALAGFRTSAAAPGPALPAPGSALRGPLGAPAPSQPLAATLI